MAARSPAWIATLLLVFGTPASWSQALDPAAVFQRASQSVVLVYALDAKASPISQGSGVVTAPGVVVTNCHVTRLASFVAIEYREKVYRARARHLDVDRDLCTFTVGTLPAPAALMLRSAQLKIGSHVYAIGAPRGLDLTLSDGLVSSLRKVEGGRLIQTTAPISRGSSGGGLFDDHARLVGITTSYLDESQQLNFAHPVEWILALPERHIAEATHASSLEYARDALSRLRADLAEIDPAYDCRRSFATSSAYALFPIRHPAEYVDIYMAAYIQAGRDYCSGAETPRLTGAAAATSPPIPLESPSTCTPARIRVGECRIARQ